MQDSYRNVLKKASTELGLEITLHPDLGGKMSSGKQPDDSMGQWEKFRAALTQKLMEMDFMGKAKFPLLSFDFKRSSGTGVITPHHKEVFVYTLNKYMLMLIFFCSHKDIENP